MTVIETKRRGRPRDPSRDRMILKAARDVMARRGFTGATMEEIATTAGVGKDTLYRRWPSKDRLAIDLVEAMAGEAVGPVPLDPDPRFNLFTFLKDIVRFNRTTDFGPLIAGIVGEAARNDDLAESFRTFWRHRRALAAELVIDVIGSDATAEAVDRILDRLLAPIYYRLLLTGDDITDEYLWDLVASLPWSAEPE
ncbi:MAG: TetR/AcrR family transcriptional regulator [Acidimicrobiia bacterium]|nr:TetR/AcrR family transcriptional regulator [Acidimicrobiia bacterium]